MLVRQLTLKRNVNVNAAYITEEKQIQEALTQLNIPYPKPVIVLVGGAGKIGFWDGFRMHKAVRIVASLAEETQSAVVDGGTQVGVMREIGRQRKRNKFCFPLIGVLFDSLLVREEPESILDPNHTHFSSSPGRSGVTNRDGSPGSPQSSRERSVRSPFWSTAEMSLKRMSTIACLKIALRLSCVEQGASQIKSTQK